MSAAVIQVSLLLLLVATCTALRLNGFNFGQKQTIWSKVLKQTGLKMSTNAGFREDLRNVAIIGKITFIHLSYWHICIIL